MLPVLFKVGTFPIHTWGILLMVGFLCATARGARSAQRYGAKSADIWDCALGGLFAGVVGGRIGFVIQSPTYFAAHPGESVALWDGGMTSFGGLIGGVAMGVYLAHKRGIKPADAADIAAIGLPIGMFFGRLGCLLNGCCYGHVCALPWAMHFFPEGHGDTGPVHPTQLYEVLGMVVVYAVLTWLERRRAFPGQLLLVFALLYSVVRFIVEIWRAQDGPQSVKLGLSTGHWFSILVVVLAGGLYAFLARRAAASR